MNIKSRDRVIYILLDFIISIVAWTMYKGFYDSIHAEDLTIQGDNLYLYGLFIIPFTWFVVYSVFDSYGDLYRQSRLSSLIKTILLALFGTLLIHIFFRFSHLIHIGDYFISGWLGYFFGQMILTATFRMIVLTQASRRLKSGKVFYRTLIVGGNKNAVDLYNEINEMPKKLGHRFVGFIDSNGNSTNELEAFLPCLGVIGNLPRIIEEQNIEDIIIAIETSEHNKLEVIFDLVFDYSHQCLIKMIPDMYDIMLGHVKMTHIYGAALIEVRRELMPRWQMVVKRIIDIVSSLIILIILSPLYLYIALRVRMSSKGSIIYKQERIGQYKKPFMIYKFRSMYVDAEDTGPQLSKDDDDRCTPWGSIMRKWRLDELPQMWNVLKGEMSLVGPRPEREFFIELIMEEAPYFKHLLKVRPGITSWGQVKYGYASNVKQMIQRLKYDILYIENMSLSLDIKILFYTILVLVQGKGK